MLAVAQDLGARADDAGPAIAAIECLHTYTLIHDDLPAMDDDDLRRGQPTVHRAFDEATAILAGDSLQAQAFAIAAPLGSAAIAALSSAAVAVVAGQQDDLDIPNDIPNSDRATISHQEQEALLLRIHRRKTGALLAASMQLGACVADATPAAGTLDRLAQAGVHLGVAFQYIDDLLDVTAGAEDLGKTPGKDAKLDKLTAVSLYGLEETQRRAHDATAAALADLRDLPRTTAVAEWLLRRTH